MSCTESKTIPDFSIVHNLCSNFPFFLFSRETQRYLLLSIDIEPRRIPVVISRIVYRVKKYSTMNHEFWVTRKQKIALANIATAVPPASSRHSKYKYRSNIYILWLNINYCLTAVNQQDMVKDENNILNNSLGKLTSK